METDTSKAAKATFKGQGGYQDSTGDQSGQRSHVPTPEESENEEENPPPKPKQPKNSTFRQSRDGDEPTSA